MIAVDSSVAVAAYASWHTLHDGGASTLQRNPRMIAQAAIETYSVLTRLPAPFRVPPGTVHEFLERNFEQEWLTLRACRHRDLVAKLSELEITGGAVYDALVAWTAQANEATLLSLDRRAAATYDLLGAPYEVIG